MDRSATQASATKPDPGPMSATRVTCCGWSSAERVRRALHVYGCDPAALRPLPGQDRRSARYLVSSRSRPDLFVKVVPRERRDSDLLYRAWRWRRHRGRPRPDRPQ